MCRNTSSILVICSAEYVWILKLSIVWMVCIVHNAGWFCNESANYVLWCSKHGVILLLQIHMYNSAATFSGSNILHWLDWPWMRTYIQIVENKQKILCFISIIVVIFITIIIYIRAISTADIERTFTIDKRLLATTHWVDVEKYSEYSKNREKGVCCEFKTECNIDY